LPFDAIALWIAHEIKNTMHCYVEADFAANQKALDWLEAPDTKAQSAAVLRIGLTAAAFADTETMYRNRRRRAVRARVAGAVRRAATIPS